MLDLHLGLTLGADEFGVLFSSVFYGIALAQSYMYYKNDFKDAVRIRLLVSKLCNGTHPWLKFFVKVITILYLSESVHEHATNAHHRVFETAHTSMLWLFLYESTVVHFDDPTFLGTSPWFLGMISAFNGVIGCMVQVWMFSLFWSAKK